MGESRGAYWVFVGKPEVTGPHGRPSRKWDNNWTLNKLVGRACTGLIWLRIGTSGGLW